MVARSTQRPRLTALALASAVAASPGAALGQEGAAEPPAGPPERPPQPEAPARTPLPHTPRTPSPDWQRHLEIGGDLAFVARTSRPSGHVGDARQKGVAYAPTIGFGIHGSWEVFRYLRFGGYFIDARHDVTLPRGALGLPPGAATRGGDGEPLQLESSVYTYVFGARLWPMLPIGARARLWASVGIGWGRFEFDRMQGVMPGGSEFEVRERSNAFVEIPVGVGASYELVRGVPGLLLQLEVTGAYVDAEEGGNAVKEFQTVIGGKLQSVGPFPSVTSSFVQTLGLSLTL